MDIKEIVLMIPGILIGFTFHEYAHAKVAVILGDDTPKYQERLNLNPFTHIDIIGFICILFAGFGWAKPVQVNPFNFKKPRRDDIIVSLAGPLMNLALAVFFLIIIKTLYYIPSFVISSSLYSVIMGILNYIVWINITLFVFNLLPIPPLDGFHIFSGLLNLKERFVYNNFFAFSSIMLPILVISNLLDKIISPTANFIYENLINIFL